MLERAGERGSEPQEPKLVNVAVGELTHLSTGARIAMPS